MSQEGPVFPPLSKEDAEALVADLGTAVPESDESQSGTLPITPDDD